MEILKSRQRKRKEKFWKSVVIGKIRNAENGGVKGQKNVGETVHKRATRKN